MDTKGRTPADRRKVSGGRRAPQKPARQQQDVVYLPAQRFSRPRLILQLVTVAAVVIALLLGISVFFKVETIRVSGNEKYTAWDVSQASGIQMGENLLTFGIPQAVARIQAALPYVQSVRIGIKLPGTVHIEIVENEVVYAVQSGSDSWWLINSQGKVLEQVPGGGLEGYTRILGVSLAGPKAGEQAQAQELEASELVDADGDPIPVTVTQAQRLQTALDIADYLERNGIIGKIATIDVQDMGDLELWYGQQYQILLGEETELSYKISCLKSALEEMAPYQAGILDISFTTWKDQIGFTAFQSGD